MKKEKLMVRGTNVQQHIERIVKEAHTATVTRTGYTAKVETERRTYYFAEGNFSGRGFGAANKAKSDAMMVRTLTPEGADVWNGVPGRDVRAPRYHNVPLHTVLPRDAVCVDIRAAYPTTLANLGIVKPDTYKALMSLPKTERLKAVGMMGTTRHVQTFDAGRLLETTTEREATTTAFFATCHHVGEVMELCTKESGEAFGFFWVDGIFVSPKAADIVCDVIGSAGYEFSRETVRNVRRSTEGRYIFYTKGDKSTYLCVPRRIEFDGAELVKKLNAC